MKLPTWTWLAAPLVLLLLVANASAAGGRQRAFEKALQAWDTAEATQILQRAQDAMGKDDQLVVFMEARLDFFLGKYQQATRLLNKIGVDPGSEGHYGDFATFLQAAATQVGKMEQQRSEHFVVSYMADKDALLIPYLLETAEAAFVALKSDLGGDDQKLGVPIRIEIYPDIHGFSRISSLTLDEIKTSGTVALCKYNRLMITSPRTLARGYRWRDTLNHEMVHYFLSRLSHNRLPLWLHEGIARFEERRWRDTEVGRFDPVEESILSEARDNDYWVELNAMVPSLAKLTRPGDTGLAFAELHGMAGLIYADGGYPAFRTILQQLYDSKSLSEVYRNSAIKSPKKLFARFKRSLKKQKLSHMNGRKFLPVQIGDGDSASTWGKLPVKVRQRIQLGDLLRDRGRYVAARKEYRLAEKDIKGVDPVISSKIAESLVMAGQWNKVPAVVGKALRLYDDDPRLHLAAGKAAYFSGKYTLAKQHLEAVLGIHPFQSDLFRLLADLYRRLGDTDKADNASRAQKLLMATTTNTDKGR